MKKRLPARVLSLAGLVAIAVAIALGAPAPVEAQLTLRLNDATAVPGGIVAITVRTYESRPLGQGQACFLVNSFLTDGVGAGVGNPFEEYLGSIVFSGEDDAQHRLTVGPGGDLEFLIEFLSASGTINDSDGPMVVHYLKLRSDLSPGDRYQLGLNAADTWLIDDEGDSIPIEIRGGELHVRSPAAPIDVEADADEVIPGRLAFVSFQTTEAIPISSGEVTFVYDDSIASDVPTVTIDLKIGEADFTVDHPSPGRTVVTFDSPGATLNRLPGDLIVFAIPTRSDVPLGTDSPVFFDAGATSLLDREGNPLDLRFEADEIEFTLD